MFKFFIYFLFVLFGLLAGIGLGAIVPLLIATIEQGFRARFTNDPSSSGFGFFILLTIPVGAIYGLILGWLYAGKLLQSGAGFRYLVQGEGMIGLVLVLLGISSFAFLCWKFFL